MLGENRIALKNKKKRSVSLAYKRFRIQHGVLVVELKVFINANVTFFERLSFDLRIAWNKVENLALCDGIRENKTRRNFF